YPARMPAAPASQWIPGETVMPPCPPGRPEGACGQRWQRGSGSAQELACAYWCMASVQAEPIMPRDVGGVVVAERCSLFEPLPHGNGHVGVDVVLVIGTENEKAGCAIATVDLGSSDPRTFIRVLFLGDV